VWFLSETEKERCVPLCGVKKPMSWVCGSSLRQRWNVVCLVWGEEAYELGVWFLLETKMECCVLLCGEAHELGMSFSLRQR
jgi:hypothetical protein